MASARFILLGTGSSGGVPRVGGDWGACDPAEPRNRRSRCSALLERQGESGEVTRILIDTSPDLREQLLAQGTTHLDAVLYTHDHADQAHGIDDVRALAIRQRAPLPVYFDAYTRSSLEGRFDYIFNGAGGYPPILASQPAVVPYVPLTIPGRGGPVELLPVDMEHGRIRCLGFRIGDLAYCNDVNGLPPRTMDALTGLDTLIIDALRYTPHPSHAHLELTLSWIAALKPRRAILTNLHVDLDYRTLLRELPAGVEPAYDGLAVDLDA
jgi:phosphoribosyl 1,2-cyclic phosphate phosphodiesterase